MNKLEKITEWIFYFLIFLLPWQTCLIWRDAVLNGYTWEYGKLCLYGSELLVWLLIVLLAIKVFKTKKIKSFSLKSFFANFNKSKQIYFFIVLLAAWTGLSIFWASDLLLAQVRWVQLLEVICVLVLILSFSFNFKKVALAFIGSAIIQSILAIWQFIIQYAFANKWLGLAEHLSVGGGAIILQTENGRWLRAYGALPHPNVLGGFLFVAIILALYLYLSSESKKIKLFVLTSLPIISAAFFFTFSRSAWLALFISFALFGIWLLFTKQIKMFKDFLLLSFFGLIIILIFSGIYFDLLSSRVVVQTDLEAQSLSLRLAFSKQAFSLIKSDWLLGQGIGNYTLSIHDKFNSSWPGYYYQPVHNIFLLVGAELGIFGFLAFCLLLFSTFYLALKRINLESLSLIIILFGFCFIGFFDHYFWTLYSGLLMFFIILAFNIKPNFKN